MRKACPACLSTCLALALWLAACRPTPPTVMPPTSSPVAQPTPARLATVKEILKVVEIRLSEPDGFILAAVGQKFGTGAQVRTGAASTARIDFDRGAINRLAPNTWLTIVALPEAKNEPLARIHLAAGKLWVTLTNGGIEVETPAGVAAVRGSYAEFEYWPGDPNNPADDVMVVRCLEGVCGVLGKNAKLVVLGNLELVTLTTNNQPPSRAFLGPEAVAEFVRNNPESAGLAPTLTAAAQPSATLSPMPSATSSRTPTPSLTPSLTRSATATKTYTLAPTGTRKPTTLTPSKTLTPWGSATWTKSLTPSRTFTPSLTPSRTLTPVSSATYTRTPSASATVTLTPIASATHTLTSAPSATHTLTPGVTATTTSTPTASSTPAGTDTPTPTVTANPTATATTAATETPTPTNPPTATDTETSTATETPTETPSPTDTP